MSAAQAPLLDLLKAVPEDARLEVKGDKSTTFIPVGKHCKDARLVIMIHENTIKEYEETIENLSDPHDRSVNAPAAQALDELWKEVILSQSPDYGDWEYPMQAKRHLVEEFKALRAKLRELQDMMR
jgi:hypothetical protein